MNAQAESGSERAAEALAELCGMYWPPVYTWIRAQGRSAHDAEDLTQEFFATLLARESLTTVAEEKGRLRTFLLVAAKRFLINDWEHRSAQKRGGGVPPLSIDHESAEASFTISDGVTPDVCFDQHWAITLLNTVLTKLEAEYAESGKGELYTELRQTVTVDAEATPYSEIATRLSMTEGAVRIAVHRLRRRYRELLHGEIAQTVDSSDEVEAEIRHLLGLFSTSSP